MTLGFALVAALIYLAWLLERACCSCRRSRSRSSSRPGSRSRATTRSTPGSSWKTRARRLGAPLRRVALARRARRRSSSPSGPSRPSSGARRSCASRGSRSVLVALVLAAGTYLAIVRLPHLRDLWTQRYGQVLLVKLALVAVALAWGARPPLRRAAAARAARATAFLGRVGRSLLGESLVGIAVLLAAAVLVDSKPPPRPSAAGHAGARGAEQLAQARRVGRRGRLVLVAEVDVRRRAQRRGERAQVVVGVRRLAQPDVAERLGLEVVHARRAPRRAVPRLVRGSRRRARAAGSTEPSDEGEQAVVAGALDDDADRPEPVAERRDALERTPSRGRAGSSASFGANRNPSGTASAQRSNCSSAGSR